MKPLAACALMLVLAPAAAQDAGALRTRTLAATCAGCHGTDGHALAEAPVPGLAGRPAEELAELLRAFRRGERAPTVMHQIAKGYDDTQIDRLAAYFAAQR